MRTRVLRAFWQMNIAIRFVKFLRMIMMMIQQYKYGLLISGNGAIHCCLVHVVLPSAENYVYSLSPHIFLGLEGPRTIRRFRE